MSSIVEEIREEGRVEGREEGRAEGRAEGREEGRAEARAEERSAFALQLLQLGQFTLEQIAEMTRLDIDAVRALAEKKNGAAQSG